MSAVEVQAIATMTHIKRAPPPLPLSGVIAPQSHPPCTLEVVSALTRGLRAVRSIVKAEWQASVPRDSQSCPQASLLLEAFDQQLLQMRLRLNLSEILARTYIAWRDFWRGSRLGKMFAARERSLRAQLQAEFESTTSQLEMLKLESEFHLSHAHALGAQVACFKDHQKVLQRQRAFLELALAGASRRAAILVFRSWGGVAARTARDRHQVRAQRWMHALHSDNVLSRSSERQAFGHARSVFLFWRRITVQVREVRSRESLEIKAGLLTSSFYMWRCSVSLKVASRYFTECQVQVAHQEAERKARQLQSAVALIYAKAHHHACALVALILHKWLHTAVCRRKSRECRRRELALLAFCCKGGMVETCFSAWKWRFEQERCRQLEFANRQAEYQTAQSEWEQIHLQECARRDVQVDEAHAAAAQMRARGDVQVRFATEELDETRAWAAKECAKRDEQINFVTSELEEAHERCLTETTKFGRDKNSLVNEVMEARAWAAQECGRREEQLSFATNELEEARVNEAQECFRREEEIRFVRAELGEACTKAVQSCAQRDDEISLAKAEVMEARAWAAQECTRSEEQFSFATEELEQVHIRVAQNLAQREEQMHICTEELDEARASVAQECAKREVQVGFDAARLDEAHATADRECARRDEHIMLLLAELTEARACASHECARSEEHMVCAKAEVEEASENAAKERALREAQVSIAAAKAEKAHACMVTECAWLRTSTAKRSLLMLTISAWYQSVQWLRDYRCRSCVVQKMVQRWCHDGAGCTERACFSSWRRAAHHTRRLQMAMSLTVHKWKEGHLRSVLSQILQLWKHRSSRQRTLHLGVRCLIKGEKFSAVCFYFTHWMHEHQHQVADRAELAACKQQVDLLQEQMQCRVADHAAQTAKHYAMAHAAVERALLVCQHNERNGSLLQIVRVWNQFASSSQRAHVTVDRALLIRGHGAKNGYLLQILHSWQQLACMLSKARTAVQHVLMAWAQDRGIVSLLQMLRLWHQLANSSHKAHATVERAVLVRGDGEKDGSVLQIILSWRQVVCDSYKARAAVQRALVTPALVKKNGVMHRVVHHWHQLANKSQRVHAIAERAMLIWERGEKNRCLLQMIRLWRQFVCNSCRGRVAVERALFTPALNNNNWSTLTILHLWHHIVSRSQRVHTTAQRAMSIWERGERNRCLLQMMCWWHQCAHNSCRARVAVERTLLTLAHEENGLMLQFFRMWHQLASALCKLAQGRHAVYTAFFRLLQNDGIASQRICIKNWSTWVRQVRRHHSLESSAAKERRTEMLLYVCCWKTTTGSLQSLRKNREAVFLAMLRSVQRDTSSLLARCFAAFAYQALHDRFKHEREAATEIEQRATLSIATLRKERLVKEEQLHNAYKQNDALGKLLQKELHAKEEMTSKFKVSMSIASSLVGTPLATPRGQADHSSVPRIGALPNVIRPEAWEPLSLDPPQSPAAPTPPDGTIKNFSVMQVEREAQEAMRLHEEALHRMSHLRAMNANLQAELQSALPGISKT